MAEEDSRGGPGGGGVTMTPARTLPFEQSTTQSERHTVPINRSLARLNIMEPRFFRVRDAPYLLQRRDDASSPIARFTKRAQMLV